MANLIVTKLFNLMLAIFIGSLALGQLTRLPLANLYGAFFLNDLLLFILIFLWLVRTAMNGRMILPPVSQPVILFILVAVVSLVNSLRLFSPGQLLAGLLLLVRFVSYFLLFLIVANSIGRRQRFFWLNLLIICALLVAFLGFVQLLILPDLTFLTIYGWDPHLNRLASTFLDPNFVGAFLVAGLILAQSLYWQNRRLWLQAASGLLLIAVVLTFSRSSYLMLAMALLLFAILQSKKVVIVFLAILLIAVLFLPKTQSRILGAFQLDPTAQARIISWQNAFTIFKNNPFLGVGFNNYRLAQAKYGFFEVANPQGGHAGAGSDSSFLTVAATTGVVGILTYLLIYGRLAWLTFAKRADPVALACFITLVSLLFHSQFVNSLFYPALMAWIWVVNGLVFCHDC